MDRDKIDGVIYFFQDNCQWAEETFPSIREDFGKARRFGGAVPLLGLHADGLISSAQNVMTTRLSAFLQGLQQIKGLHPAKEVTDGSRPSIPNPQMNHKFFVGIDAGSSYVKVVIVNENREVLAHARGRVAADIHDAVTLCLEKVLGSLGTASGQWSSLIATGVSQESVDRADYRLSEVMCHAAAIKRLLPEVAAFIEVGGRDVKGMDLATGLSELNDRCAAGIGTFLEEFCSMLNVKRHDCLRLYNTSDGAVRFPTLCKAIIQTEVRHAVARRESLPKIVKGFYDALATIVLNSVRSKIPRDARFVGLCGGAAMDSAFVNAMRNALSPLHEIHVAQNPIYTGALGAALLALEYANGHTNAGGLSRRGKIE